MAAKNLDFQMLIAALVVIAVSAVVFVFSFGAIDGEDLDEYLDSSEAGDLNPSAGPFPSGPPNFPEPSTPPPS